MCKDILCCILDDNTSNEALKKELNLLDQPNWENLLEMSTWNGIKPLVYLRLKPLFVKATIPASIQNELRNAYLLSARKNTLILHHAAKMLKTLKAHGIDLIGLKGIYLVENIYDNIAARPFGDIDIMIKKEDLQNAITSLQKLGYRMSTYFSISDVNLDIKHVPPMINAEGLTTEIHWTILEEDEPFTIDAQGLWERASPAKIAGVDALALSPEDLILHLCMHLTYQHRLKIGLRGLYDIAEVLRHFEGQVNWTKLSKITQEWGSGKVTWLTLTLAQDLLGAQIPPKILAHLQPKHIDPWVLKEAKAQLLHWGVRTVAMTPDLAELASEKKLIRQIKLILSRVFLPKQTLARLYGVPPRSVRIYGCYFLRFSELVRRYGGAVRRIAKKDHRVLSGTENEQTVARLRQWMVKR
ncbi:MAG: nucleotidyltransferase family protein [Chloroflexota bacterium]|nr:nucleotidyltransferase family protein [Chloroflexota bacterium]